MATPCPFPGDLYAYQLGSLPPAQAESLERHSAACADCRETLLLLASHEVAGERALPEASVQRLIAIRKRPAFFPVPFRRAAAAALILAALGGFWAVRPSRTGLPPSAGQGEVQPTALPPAFPEGRLGQGDTPSAYLVSGAELLLGSGARVASEGSRRLRPETGTAWLEVSRGQPATLLLPGANLTLTRGSLAVSLPRSRSTAWFLGEALAGEEPLAQAWVLRGEAQAFLEGERRQVMLEAGNKLLLDAEGARIVPLTAQEAVSLEAERASALLALPGTLLVSQPLKLSGPHPSVEASLEKPGTYRWVTLLTDRSPSTELGFTLEAGGTWYQWVAGLGGIPPSPRELLELTWDGERLTGRLNGMHCLAVDRARLGEALKPAPRTAWGISVWQGTATVQRSLLHEEGVR